VKRPRSNPAAAAAAAAGVELDSQLASVPAASRGRAGQGSSKQAGPSAKVAKGCATDSPASAAAAAAAEQQDRQPVDAPADSCGKAKQGSSSKQQAQDSSEAPEPPAKMAKTTKKGAAASPSPAAAAAAGTGGAAAGAAGPASNAPKLCAGDLSRAHASFFELTCSSNYPELQVHPVEWVRAADQGPSSSSSDSSTARDRIVFKVGEHST
jgi:hypothetical protein